MAKKSDPDVAAIKALDAEWSKAATAHDINRVVTFYAKDGSVVWPNQAPAKGHAAIRASWNSILTPDMYLDFKPIRIEVFGDLASDFGEVHFKRNAKPGDTQNTAKYLVVWKRENGAWKVLYDCWNWNAPLVLQRAPK
jgi:uncharacterized protein (TIGR02246 family)